MSYLGYERRDEGGINPYREQARPRQRYHNPLNEDMSPLMSSGSSTDRFLGDDDLLSSRDEFGNRKKSNLKRGKSSQRS